MDSDREARGTKAGFDPVTGKVYGSGSGAGGGNPGEDYDADPMAGAGADPVQAPRAGDARAGAAPPEETARHDPADPVDPVEGFHG